ncbi:MAG TPA: HAD family hydrolase [Lachnospiraceae bacterium]|nr:HAD family hydrolase [Lachnospiraceae bacterium]
MKADGVIFDLDGTLWDATENVARSWNQVLPELGYESKNAEDLKRCMGLPMEELFGKLFPGAGHEELRRLSEKLYAAENAYIEKHGGVLYEGLEDTLKALEGKYLLAVVSNCQAGYIEAFLKAHNLGKYFADYESLGGTGLLKAGNIRLVADRNHLKYPVYVGDIQGDCDAAHEAGTAMIHAAYGFGEVVGAEGVIRSITELPELLEQA